DAATCPAPGGGWSRLSGTDRYSTAVAVGNENPGGQAYVASGEAFADALAAGPVVGNGTLLLVGREVVPEATRAELVVLQPSRVVVVGGTAVVAPSVEATLRTLTRGTVTRVAGSDRYATAAALVAAGFPDRTSIVRLVAGATFADALAAGASGAPVLLTRHDALPQATIAELTRLAPTTVEIVGGTVAIGEAVEAATRAVLPQVLVRRIAGADRYQTAAALAAAVGTAGAATFLTTGGDFPDALAAIPAAIRRQAPLLLAPPDGSIPSQLGAVVDGRPASELVVVGGTTSIPDDVIVRLRPATIACLLVDTAQLRAGEPTTATVRLRAPAPPGGALVALAATNAGVTLPATLTIPAGVAAGAFTFTAARPALTAGTVITASAGASSRSVTLQIASVQPSITSFASNVTVLTAGQAARLTWTTTSAVGCSIDNGVGAVACNGSTTVIPGATKTYTLSASSEDLTVTTSATFTVGQRSRFLYATHSNPTTKVSALSADATTGQLTVIGAALSTGIASNPAGVAVDAAGRYAYVALNGNNQIAMFTIDATTGALTANGTVGTGGAPQGNAPQGIVVDPSGRYVFVANRSGDAVAAYTIGATGQLTSNGGTIGVGAAPVDIAVDPTGRYVYVLCANAQRVDAFTIGTDGQLTSNGTIATGTVPRTVVVDPSGKYLYVSNVGDLNVQRYSIGSTGTLTSLGLTAMTGGGSPNGIAVHPSGTYLYAAYANRAFVGTWAIGADGDLTFVGEVATSGASGWITIDSAGRYAYLQGTNNVQQYSVDATTGAFAPLPSPTAATDANVFRLAGGR
ncbi:MAG: hypothetical protein JWM05_1190, partial [Acidimicrobiales bacterium]|nr:hypothetical protein [Acidimicrobiales bacterium]